MGEVYGARDTRLDRDVAIKILPDVFAADPDRLARLERETETLAALNHPHIGAVKILDFGLAKAMGAGSLAEPAEAARRPRPRYRGNRRSAVTLLTGPQGSTWTYGRFQAM